MQRTIVILAISLLAIVASVAFIVRTVDTRQVDFSAVSGVNDERLQALELAVSEERAARQMLEEQLLLLFEEIDRLEAQRGLPDENRIAVAALASEPDARRFQLRGETVPQSAADKLLEAGLSQQRVDWIFQREQELRFEAMQARYRAVNSGDTADALDPGLNPDAMLRAELGDADYEKYLQAYGRPTSVAVANVLASSPAANAGLQPGDHIVSYDGQRVFDGGDLTQRVWADGTGTVVVDVMRDGAPLQVVLPRGPIGIEIGRFRRR